MKTTQFLPQLNCRCLFRTTHKGFHVLESLLCCFNCRKGAEKLTFLCTKRLRITMTGWRDGWGLYYYLNACIGRMPCFKNPRWIQVKATMPQQFFDKLVKIRWRRQVEDDFKSWRQLLSAKGSRTQYLWSCTFAFYLASVSSFLFSASEAVSPPVSPLGHNRERCAVRQTDRQKERHTDRLPDR